MMKPMTPSAYIYYRTGSFADSARLVQAIGELPGIQHNPPAVDVREGGVTIRLLTITWTSPA
jgi:4a-hydroxytetrahydrobiopterin dehydratase